MAATMRRDSILVEFLGLPGAGKSALSRRVAAELQRRRLPVDEPSRPLAHDISRASRARRKSLRVALELLRHPLDGARAARILAGSRQPSAGECARLLFNWLLVTSLARDARRRAGLHLIDEGLAQGAWSVALEGRLESALALLAALPAGTAPDVVVVLESSPAAIAARLQSRPEHDTRLDSRLDTEPLLLKRGAVCVERIQDALGSIVAARDASRLVRACNEQPADLDARAAELAGALESRARAAGCDGGPSVSHAG
jgi:thymidylate kinase